MKRLQETSNTGTYTCTTALTDEGIETTNHTTGASGAIRYTSMKKLVQTEHYYMLFTKANQFVPINRQAIDQNGQREALMEHLRAHCPQIKL